MKDDKQGEGIQWVHTLVIGSGAAGLTAALQLWMAGNKDILIITEGLDKGTSINTGSDKQTYYKLSQYGADEDSPLKMAETFYAGGSMHGDLAFIEAANSTRAFFNLVSIGVPFPHDQYGQYIGYKTDHDPQQRATSVGPYTSREMCHALIRQVQVNQIPVTEGMTVVRLVILEQDGNQRCAGAIAVDHHGRMHTYGSENVILAVGGPGGLYESSVYPEVHTGGIGLGFLAGAESRNLPESQYGMASTKIRWNVSGSYMQVIPRFVSFSDEGVSDGVEFLNEYFKNQQTLHNMEFLKGYQWPFDARKVQQGSSLIDILVYQETVIKKRRVFLDYSINPENFSLSDLSQEAISYLSKSNATGDTPIKRLQALNPDAYELYLQHGIDLAIQPLEIAICAQHNNGGLAGNIWWESTNINHLFPIGEVNGSHGVYRPGGSALNAGQVGAIRSVEYIVAKYHDWSLNRETTSEVISRMVMDETAWLSRCLTSKTSWEEERIIFQKRMSRVGAHIRSHAELPIEIERAREQWMRICSEGCRYKSSFEIPATFQTKYLCLAHFVYLQAIQYALECGVGSRGSMIVLVQDGKQIHPNLPLMWKYQPENPSFRDKVLVTSIQPTGETTHHWEDRQPIPTTNGWFETMWADFKNGKIY